MVLKLALGGNIFTLLSVISVTIAIDQSQTCFIFICSVVIGLYGRAGFHMIFTILDSLSFPSIILVNRPSVGFPRVLLIALVFAILVGYYLYFSLFCFFSPILKTSLDLIRLVNLGSLIKLLIEEEGERGKTRFH